MASGGWPEYVGGASGQSGGAAEASSQSGGANGQFQFQRATSAIAVDGARPAASSSSKQLRLVRWGQRPEITRSAGEYVRVVRGQVLVQANRVCQGKWVRGQVLYNDHVCLG